jgi:hypothetical protein
MCFSYSRESRLSIQPNFRRSDVNSFDHHGIRSFNGSLRSVVQSTNAEFVRAGDYRHRFGVHGRGPLCRAAIATVAIFGSNGFSWNYFSVDAGVRVRRSLRRIQNPEFAVGVGFSPESRNSRHCVHDGRLAARRIVRSPPTLPPRGVLGRRESRPQRMRRLASAVPSGLPVSSVARRDDPRDCGRRGSRRRGSRVTRRPLWKSLGGGPQPQSSAAHSGAGDGVAWGRDQSVRDAHR